MTQKRGKIQAAVKKKKTLNSEFVTFTVGSDFKKSIPTIMPANKCTVFPLP